MKHAAIAIASLGKTVAAVVGIEGAFLLIGTALLGVGAAYISPAGPFFVVGGMSVLAGIALALPRRT